MQCTKISTLPNVLETVEPIIDNINALGEVPSNNIYLLTLAYIWTRGEFIYPVFSHLLPLGYGYSFIDNELLKNNVKSKVYFSQSVPVLNYLTKLNLLRRKLIEVANSCSKCGSIHILLRDACNNCGSIDIYEENLIHHFKCSLQERESTFLPNNDPKEDYFCPYCKKVLVEIGIDYDKPGIIHVCRKCNHYNSDTQVFGRCLVCNSVFPGEEAVVTRVYSYKITHFGKKILYSKEENLFNVNRYLENNLKQLSFKNFILLVNKLSKLENLNVNSVIFVINIHKEFSKKISSDFVRAISPFMKEADTMSFYFGDIYVLFNNFSEEEYKKIKKKVNNIALKSFNEEATNVIKTQTMTLRSFLNFISGVVNEY